MIGIAIRRGIVLLLLVMPFGALAQNSLQEFDATSLAKIKNALIGRPFVLALWSVHCAPCREDLPRWSELRRKYPDTAILLVAADTPEERATISSILSRYEMGGVELYAFADTFTERIRYAVDRKWQGELPRTYLYDANHLAQAHSGTIKQEKLEAWIKRQGR
ncbi:MAG: hypothetical protein ABL878_05680 [Burkholderiales bacterium]